MSRPSRAKGDSASAETAGGVAAAGDEHAESDVAAAAGHAGSAVGSGESAPAHCGGG